MTTPTNSTKAPFCLAGLAWSDLPVNCMLHNGCALHNSCALHIAVHFTIAVHSTIAVRSTIAVLLITSALQDA